MPNAKLSTFSKRILKKGELSAADMLKLRRIIGADFSVSITEADILFQINETVKTPEDWPVYFVTVITSFLIHQTQPEGYISDINAAWLLQRIEHDGVVETQTELALVLNLIRHAHNVTESVETFALEQVSHAVLKGDGYLGKHHKLEPGIIGQTEVEILRQVLYGVSSPGGASINRTEAEFLVRLNEATTGREHHPDWQKLFVLALANHLMVQAAWEEPSAQEVIRRQNWLEKNDGPQLGWGNLTVKAAMGEISNVFTRKRDEPLQFKHMDEVANAEAEKITSNEADWLINRLNRDGGIDANERALLEFLAEECPNIHASLKPYLKAA